MAWQLKSLIGVGTVAEVWRAQRVDVQGKPFADDVALKISLYHIDDERIQRERTVLHHTAPLQHPGTVRILDVTERNERLVVAMELAEDSIMAVMRRDPPVAECLRYIGEVAATLDDLHGRNVLHGGINPTDILILNGHAKLADFGPLPDGVSPTRTPFYKAICMAPELRRGERMRASDQYALAATYGWLRLQDRAFPIPGRGELPEGIAITRLPEPDQRVLLIAMHPDPKQRFPSCRAFVEALRQVV
jgi:serine/threonine protein kinase